MTKLCVLIGEGQSERYFIPSLLESQFDFKPLSDKNPNLFKKSTELFWFFPFPPQASNPEGGKARLKKTETYRLVNPVIENYAYIFNDNAVEIHYRIIVDHAFTDKVGQETKKNEIKQALTDSGVPYSSCKVEIVENEIECWYFAGLTENFPYFNKSDPSLIKTLLTQECERISDPKGNIKKVLSANIQGAIKMADIMGKNIDINQARTKSTSFNTFLSGLESDSLL